MSSPADFALALYCLVKATFAPFWILRSSVNSSFALTLEVAPAAVKSRLKRLIRRLRPPFRQSFPPLV